MAHVMLPGYAPESETEQRTKYAGNAIDELLNQMKAIGCDLGRIEICLMGGRPTRDGVID